MPGVRPRSPIDIRALVPDQSGRTAFVTGGTAGLGLELATELAAKGATVLVGGRDPERGEHAVARAAERATSGSIRFVPLDLMDLASVADAAATVAAHGRLDLLIDNAGIMAPPLEFSVEGYESQWATNVIGPFALTAQLLPVLELTAGSRVVTVSSIAHLIGAFDLARMRLDLQGQGYIPFIVYGRTKLAGLLVARELQRRLASVGSSTLSVAAHPGVAATEIAANPVKWAGQPAQDAVLRLWRSITRSPELAMQPILAAATAPLVRGGDYLGPQALFQTRGRPARVPSTPRSQDPHLAREVVDYLEEITGVPLEV